MANVLSLSNISVRKRLLFLMFFLLLSVIVTFGYTSYFAIKKGELAQGKERLNSLTEQVSSMFKQLGVAIIATTRETANASSIKKYLQSGEKDSMIAARQALDKAKVEPLFPLVELFDAHRCRVLSSGEEEINKNGEQDSITFSNAEAGELGKLYLVDTAIYFPIIVAITDKNHILGYLVKWRKLVTTPQEIEQFSNFIGAEGALYIGNDDGKLWTNGMISIPSPPVDQSNVKNMISYTGPRGYAVLASASRVPGTRWEILIALSQKVITQTANHFLNWVIGAGIILLGIGVLLTLLLSRSITAPLKKLTAATDAVAAGNFNLQVKIHGKNELGKLAEAFNSMAIQVQTAQHDLEKKVLDRTIELESANKELHAFSYSVSHDLRSPLRVINGYAAVLAEQHKDVLTDEGKRCTRIIMNNATHMGTLIDDLLNLSHLGKTALNIQPVNMHALVSSILEEPSSLTDIASEIKVGNLEVANCDQNLIRQVWVNLISNAVKYSSKKEKGFIEIGNYCKGNEIVYFVKDNGAGFDMRFADKLFGVFQRLHQRTEFEGIGIGLAIVHRIITKHNGAVWAHSEVGQGATFYFSLPS